MGTRYRKHIKYIYIYIKLDSALLLDLDLVHLAGIVMLAASLSQ